MIFDAIPMMKQADSKCMYAKGRMMALERSQMERWYVDELCIQRGV